MSPSTSFGPGEINPGDHRALRTRSRSGRVIAATLVAGLALAWKFRGKHTG
jgi:hypothetical protein